MVGRESGHSQAPERVAKIHGYCDWNSLNAAIGKGPVVLGQVVEEGHLTQQFLGEAIGIKQCSEGRYQVTSYVDQPVSVVPFDRFSNFRCRVTKMVGADGRSVGVTSTVRRIWCWICERYPLGQVSRPKGVFRPV